MLKHVTKTFVILFVFLSLSACHEPPALTKTLAFDLLNPAGTLGGYTITMAINNPTARGNKPNGWDCEDKQHLVDADVVACKTVGRSGVYLKFTTFGEQFLVGKPWGTKKVRNARVLATVKKVNAITSIELIDDKHAFVTYTWVHERHTPFASAQLKNLIKLNVPQTKTSQFVLEDDNWVLKS